MTAVENPGNHVHRYLPTIAVGGFGLHIRDECACNMSWTRAYVAHIMSKGDIVLAKDDEGKDNDRQSSRSGEEGRRPASAGAAVVGYDKDLIIQVRREWY